MQSSLDVTEQPRDGFIPGPAPCLEALSATPLTSVQHACWDELELRHAQRIDDDHRHAMVFVGSTVDSAAQDQAIVHLRAVVGVLQMGENQSEVGLTLISRTRLD